MVVGWLCVALRMAHRKTVALSQLSLSLLMCCSGKANVSLVAYLRGDVGIAVVTAFTVSNIYSVLLV